jgi:hypothetical protein
MNKSRANRLLAPDVDFFILQMNKSTRDESSPLSVELFIRRAAERAGERAKVAIERALSVWSGLVHDIHAEPQSGRDHRVSSGLVHVLASAASQTTNPLPRCRS